MYRLSDEGVPVSAEFVVKVEPEGDEKHPHYDITITEGSFSMTTRCDGKALIKRRCLQMLNTMEDYTY